VTVSVHLPGPAGTGLLRAARDSFTHGMNLAAAGAGIAMVIAAALSVAFLRGVRVETSEASAAESTRPADNAGVLESVL